jgi:hypothetical protein
MWDSPGRDGPTTRTIGSGSGRRRWIATTARSVAATASRTAGAHALAGFAGIRKVTPTAGPDGQAVDALSMSGRPRGVRRPASTARLRPSGAWTARAYARRPDGAAACRRQTDLRRVARGGTPDRYGAPGARDRGGSRRSPIGGDRRAGRGGTWSCRHRCEPRPARAGRRWVRVREVDHNQNAEVIFATQAGRDALDA